jgi:hypothetical protein
MTVVRTVEYHCDLCGDPNDKDAVTPMRGLDYHSNGTFSLIPMDTAATHICGACWNALKTAMRGEDSKTNV